MNLVRGFTKALDLLIQEKDFSTEIIYSDFEELSREAKFNCEYQEIKDIILYCLE